MKKPANKLYHYSLLDRLTKGNALPHSSLSPFQQAVKYVFGNRVLKRAVGKAKDSQAPTDLYKALPFIVGMDATSNLFNEFVHIGRWNPLSWLEVLTLFWLNTATRQHARPKHSFLKNIVTGLNIMAAYTFNAAAKTLNLIGTPVVIAALGVFALAMGLTTGILVLALTAVFMTAIAVYCAFIYHDSREPGTEITAPNLLSFYKEAAWSIVLGIFTPLIRAFENLKNLYDKHPYIAVAAGIVGVTAVLLLAVFPHIGIGALLGFKLGGMIIAPIVNALTVSATGPLGAAILTKTALLAFSVGIMDACVRGFKEIADSIDSAVSVKDAKDEVFIRSYNGDSASHSYDSEGSAAHVVPPPLLPSGGHRAGASAGSKGTNADDYTPPNTPKL